jgi:hypothetical protein
MAIPPSANSDTGDQIFARMAFVISKTSGNEETLQDIIQRIQAKGGTVRDTLFELYSKPTARSSRGSIRLVDATPGLRAIFVLELGSHFLSAKVLLALSMGVPVLSGSFVEDAIAEVSKLLSQE